MIKGGAIITGPDPYGLSGSGLWYLPRLIVENTESVPSKLIDIMIEYRKNEKIMVATKIDLITEVIRQRFCPDIPQSKTVKVNLSTE